MTEEIKGPVARKSVAERLDLDQLRDLKRDMEFIATNSVIIFAIDAYDVLKFCFPTALVGSQDFKDAIEVHADYSAAVHYALNHDKWRPLLLPEYLAEIHGFVASSRGEYQTPHSDTTFAKDLAATVRSHVPDLDAPDRAEKSLEFIKKSFSVLLLYLKASIMKFGYRELAELMSDRFVSISDLTGSADDHGQIEKIARQFARTYQPNWSFISQCEKILEFPLLSVAPTPGLTSRYPASNRADAIAFDRILQLNHQLATVRPGALNRNYRVCLLSSSTRLQRLQHELQKHSLVGKNAYAGEALRILRVPDQIFAYVITHPQPAQDTDSVPTAKANRLAESQVIETLGWLIELEADTKRLKESNSSDPSIRRQLEVLQLNRRKILEPYQDWYENLALFARMKTSPRMQQLESLRSTASLENNESLLALVQNLLRDKELEPRTSDALHTQRDLVRARTILAHRWCRIRAGETVELGSQSTRDKIRGLYHALPWLLRLTDASTIRVLSIARSAFFNFAGSEEQRTSLVGDAFEALLNLDNHDVNDRRVRLERDLVRALLFLSLRDVASEDAAVSLARQVRQEDHGNIEANYVLTWAQRRAGRFREARDTAIKGQSLAIDDPRFAHAAALARFAMYQARSDMSELRLAIADLKNALNLYRVSAFIDPDLKRVMIGSCLNGLAYVTLLAGDDTKSIKTAASFLTELTGLGLEWDPFFPEFFHTQASLFYRDSANWSGAVRAAKLRTALAAAENAARLAPVRPDYLAFETEIRKSLGAADPGSDATNFNR